MKKLICLTLLITSLTIMVYSEKGYASWYGGVFQGKLTSNGEVFDTNLLTAAHKTLPFGTIVKVTNLENGKSVEVRVNDRGPFIKGRIIDLTRKAASQLDMLNSGVAYVELHIVEHPEEIQKIIQIGSYKSPRNAQNQVNILKEKGFNAHTHRAEGVIRVYIKAVPESEIPDLKRQLRQAGYSSVLVRSPF
ncbi:septal ring lytic transglycosylase RlpA family protein [Spirochaeta cellobiosiphila]|uniref:septal ring lytic transglycosylase RlpA family protein n=1 Tax=Spirochaeta cellobiosiphila TaxID=504483 RepID=UPI001B7FE051|nr:septal ring lytic transglycosylase RlpA family protein [Spirochaeta cellobiosiphila]